MFFKVAVFLGFALASQLSFSRDAYKLQATCKSPQKAIVSINITKSSTQIGWGQGTELAESFKKGFHKFHEIEQYRNWEETLWRSLYTNDKLDTDEQSYSIEEHTTESVLKDYTKIGFKIGTDRDTLSMSYKPSFRTSKPFEIELSGCNITVSK